MDQWLECSNGRNKTCTIEWGEESFEDALMWAYRNSDNEEIVDGSVLDESYYATRLPIVERRILAAGVRLAATLESIFGGPPPPSSSSFSLLASFFTGFAMRQGAKQFDLISKLSSL
jgi:hypothetical protein